MMRDARGFSLVELSISLAISSALGIAAWQLLVVNRNAVSALPATEQLLQTSAAIEGFTLNKHRLPCPASDADGRENCAGASIGLLAWRDLGLPQAYSVVRYGAYRTASHDLTQALARYAPNLPSGFVTTGINGLDLCTGLRKAAGNPIATNALTVGGTNGIYVAFALAHPGKDMQFQGLNVASFDMPNKAIAGDYDDVVMATGLSELSGRLGCPALLGAANTAARASYGAYDINRNAEQFVRYRNFTYEVSVGNTGFGAATVAMATTDLAIAVADTVTAVSIALNSAGIGFGVVAAAVLGVGAAAVAIPIFATLLVLSGISQTKAANTLDATINIQIDTQVTSVVAGARAISIVKKGLTP